jgi:hypothetical protein
VQTDVTLRSYAFTRPEAKNMVILQYTIHNYSSNPQLNFHAGLFFDWDVSANSQSDVAIFNDSLKLALTYDSTGYPCVPVAVGTVLLTPELGTTYWGINNRDNDSDTRIGIYNGFSKEEKWKALSTGIVQPIAGVTDVSQLLSMGPVDLQPGDSLNIGFALIAGDTPQDVMASVPHSRAMWDTINRLFDPTDIAMPTALPEGMQLHGIAPHPATLSNGSITLDISTVESGTLQIELYDLRGKHVATLASNARLAGRHRIPIFLPNMATGVYVLHLKSLGDELRTLLHVLR